MTKFECIQQNSIFNKNLSKYNISFNVQSYTTFGLCILLLITGITSFKLHNSKTEKIKTIILDAGHGGEDLGCMGKHAIEKDISLQVTLKLGAYIKAYLPDIHIIYTRESDIFVSLSDRTKIANDSFGDLFLSIHCNAVRKQTKIKGAETYVYGGTEESSELARRENKMIYLDKGQSELFALDPETPAGNIKFQAYQQAYLQESIKLAGHILQQIGGHTKRPVRQVKQDQFIVLKTTNMPSTLVEMGFVSNPEEELYLLSEHGQDEMAKSIFLGLKAYLEEKD